MNEEDRLAEERAFDESPRSEHWTLPRLSEVQQMDSRERHVYQQDISSALEMKKQYGDQAHEGPPRYGPGERERWLLEQDRRRRTGEDDD